MPDNNLDTFLTDLQCEDIYQLEIDLNTDKFFIDYINKGVELALDTDNLPW